MVTRIAFAGVLMAAAFVLPIATVRAEPLALDAVSARAGTNSDGRPSVRVILSEESRRLFEQFTNAHVGRVLEYRLGGSVLMRPRLLESISGGQLIVSGSFSLDEANSIASHLSSGAKLEVDVTSD